MLCAVLDGNCYERICREISSSEAKDSLGRKLTKDKAGALPPAVYTGGNKISTKWT